jgi:hypothetical protein
MTNKIWTLEVQEDPETGDAILEFPPELLKTAGWQEGDTLTWTDLGNGSWSLTKKQPDVTIEEEEAWRDLEAKQSKA